jgi:quinol monooxygenase YgiN
LRTYPRPDGQGTEVDISNTAGIVSINVMYPLKGCEVKALAILREVVERSGCEHSGLVRTRVYRSLDGRTLATHAEWKSKAQFDAMLRDDEFVRRFNQLRELGLWESHVYEVTDDVHAIVPSVNRT